MIELPTVETESLVRRLVEILATPSPTGDTEAASALVSSWLSELGVDWTRTRRGALVATVPGMRGDSPRAVTAHLDTLGAIVKQIKPNGRLAFNRLGGYPYFSVNGEYCQIATAGGDCFTGTAVLVKSSVHVHREPTAEKEWTIDEIEIRLDTPGLSAVQTRSLGIDVGDIIRWDPRTVVTDTGYVKSRHLDDKAGVVVMLEALQALRATGLVPAQRTTFHFSVCEESGYGASSGVPADVAELISVDMGALGEGQQGDEHAVSICAQDSGGPYDLALRRRLVALAKSYGLPHHLDIYPYYGSDAETAIRAGGDHRIGLIGPGVDASHSFERTHTDGLLASTRLLLAYLLND